MKPKTQEQINTEIKTLKAMKPNVQRRTMFGENNWEKIDAEVEVLEEGLSEDDIFNREDAEWSQDVVSTALYARHWADGEEKEAPSAGWKPLVVKSAKAKT